MGENYTFWFSLPFMFRTKKQRTMENLVEKIEYKGLVIKIKFDDSPESPRSWCNIGKMICFHKRYNLGDKHDYRVKDYSSFKELEKAIIKKEKAAIILPLYLYDHSGITMKTTPFGDPWDSGQVGFVLASKEKIRKEYNKKRISNSLLKKVEKILIAEVETYDQFLRGEVFGFCIEDEKGETIDSCWGHYGINFVKEEAKKMAESLVTA